MIYIIGSLANKNIRVIAQRIREGTGVEVFDDWHASGEAADHEWKAYHKERGMSYKESLASPFVCHAFEFDLANLTRADIGVLVMPAGRSGHLELGWMLGQGKLGYILFPDGEPERPDLMTKLATDIFFSVEELIHALTSTYTASDNKLYKKLGAHSWLYGFDPSLERLGSGGDYSNNL